MSEVRAVVVKVDGTHAWVKLSERAGGCGRCDEPGGCRSAKISHAFKAPEEVFPLANPINARPGDAVRVRVEEGAPLRAALATYGLASVLLVAGAAIGASVTGNGDLGALVGAGGGVALALVANRVLLTSRGWRSGLKLELVKDEGGCLGLHEAKQ